MAKRKKRLPETERVSELGSLGGFGPEEMEQLLRLRGLIIKHLLAKFESGIKITFTETQAAVTLLKRAGLIDLQAEPEEVPAAQVPAQEDQGTAQEAPGAPEIEGTATDARAPAAPTRWLPFPARTP